MAHNKGGGTLANDPHWLTPPQRAGSARKHCLAQGRPTYTRRGNASSTISLACRRAKRHRRNANNARDANEIPHGGHPWRCKVAARVGRHVVRHGSALVSGGLRKSPCASEVATTARPISKQGWRGPCAPGGRSKVVIFFSRDVVKDRHRYQRGVLAWPSAKRTGACR